MPRKHVQRAKTNSSNWPTMLHVTDNHSTTFQWEMCSQGLNERGAWLENPARNRKSYKWRIHFKFTPCGEAVYSRKKKVRCSNRFCPRRRTTSGGPNMPHISNMRRAFPDKTCTLTGSLAWSLFTKTHRPAKTRGHRSDRPQLRVCVCVCERARVHVWRPPAFRQKNCASGAGKRPKMTRHWFHRYCRNGCFTRPPSPAPSPPPPPNPSPPTNPQHLQRRPHISQMGKRWLSPVRIRPETRDGLRCVGLITVNLEKDSPGESIILTASLLKDCPAVSHSFLIPFCWKLKTIFSLDVWWWPPPLSHIKVTHSKMLICENKITQLFAQGWTHSTRSEELRALGQKNKNRFMQILTNLTFKKKKNSAFFFLLANDDHVPEEEWEKKKLLFVIYDMLVKLGFASPKMWVNSKTASKTV